MMGDANNTRTSSPSLDASIAEVEFRWAGYPRVLEKFNAVRELDPPEEDLAALCHALAAHNCDTPLIEIASFYEALADRHVVPDAPTTVVDPLPPRSHWERLSAYFNDRNKMYPLLIGLALGLSASTLALVVGRPAAPINDPPRTFAFDPTQPHEIGTLYHTEASDPPTFQLDTGESGATAAITCTVPKSAASITLSCTALTWGNPDMAPSHVFDLRRGKLVQPSHPPERRINQHAPWVRPDSIYGGTWRGVPTERVGAVTFFPASDPPRYLIRPKNNTEADIECVAVGDPGSNAAADLSCEPRRTGPSHAPSLVFDLARGRRVPVTTPPPVTELYLPAQKTRP